MGLFDSLVSKVDDIKNQATQKVNGLKSTAESLKSAGLDKLNQAKSAGLGKLNEAKGAAEGAVGSLKQKAAGEVAKLKQFQKVGQSQLGAAKDKFKDGIGVLSDLNLPASAKEAAAAALANPAMLGGVGGVIKGAPAGLKGLLNDKAGGAVYAITHFDPAAKVLKIAKAGILKGGIPTFG